MFDSLAVARLFASVRASIRATSSRRSRTRRVAHHGISFGSPHSPRKTMRSGAQVEGRWIPHKNRSRSDLVQSGGAMCAMRCGVLEENLSGRVSCPEVDYRPYSPDLAWRFGVALEPSRPLPFM